MRKIARAPSPTPLEAIHAVVARIPRGKVATYGQVAALAGLPGHARQAGTALRDAPDGLPWQRVVNARGEISHREGGLGWEEGWQRHLLEEEGVIFDKRGRIDLERYGWDPEAKPHPRRRSAALSQRKPTARKGRR